MELNNERVVHLAKQITFSINMTLFTQFDNLILRNGLDSHLLPSFLVLTKLYLTVGSFSDLFADLIIV